MGFFKKLFTGPSTTEETGPSTTEEREVKIHVDEDLIGKKGSNDPNFLIAKLLDFIKQYPDRIDGEIMGMLTKKNCP